MSLRQVVRQPRVLVVVSVVVVLVLLGVVGVVSHVKADNLESLTMSLNKPALNHELTLELPRLELQAPLWLTLANKNPLDEQAPLGLNLPAGLGAPAQYLSLGLTLGNAPAPLLAALALDIDHKALLLG